MNYLEHEIEVLQNLLKIPSVLSKKKRNMPFGENNYKALNYLLDLGKEFGFETYNDKNFAGHIDYGNGDKPFAVLCHLDVVPKGSGWTKPPFEGFIEDNKIYGRGALDNKGPVVAVLFALKKLKDEGFLPQHTLRLILGCNEESGWKCMEHYSKSVPMPKTGFSPDSDFPVINVEKGVLHLKIEFKNTSKKLKRLNGGTRVNVVPDICSFEFDKKLYEYKGVSAHGSNPEKGGSAIFKAFKKINELEYNKTIDTINRFLVDNIDGKKLKINFADNASGKLTLNFGTVELIRNKIICGVDIRFPITYTKEQVLEQLNVLNAKVEIQTYHKPLFVDKNSELIIKLLSAYKKVTNLDGNCLSIGGATYARVLETGVAFGPLFPKDVSIIHEADEYISIEHLQKITDIYYEALKLF
ncbi:MAG: Sapep family Mn(2+)-dependent dipeptidase [Firmicutes bacterium]|nr:Sapep family Mn(2+)-dependent dipeptidase [Bacillota bacterium]